MALFFNLQVFFELALLFEVKTIFGHPKVALLLFGTEQDILCYGLGLVPVLSWHAWKSSLVNLRTERGSQGNITPFFC